MDRNAKNIRVGSTRLVETPFYISDIQKLDKTVFYTCNATTSKNVGYISKI